MNDDIYKKVIIRHKTTPGLYMFCQETSSCTYISLVNIIESKPDSIKRDLIVSTNGNYDKIYVGINTVEEPSFSSGYQKIKPDVKNLRDYITLIFTRQIVFVH